MMLLSCFPINRRPRYKTLVNGIYPTQIQDGLDKTNMERLTFYAVSYPEKVDLIGKYLCKKCIRDLKRNRKDAVRISVEAMDQLLVTCRLQSLNLFVDSFLKMLKTLLESVRQKGSESTDIQILATNSFADFSNIEEDVPSYHRCYDFFIMKFSEMCCECDYADEGQIFEIRLAGIKGLEAVIRKTTFRNGGLAWNIWQPIFMNVIVPALLFNMHESNSKCGEKVINNNSNDKLNVSYSKSTLFSLPSPVDLRTYSESCFCMLISRTSFGHVESVIVPVWEYFDAYTVWNCKPFAIHCIRLILLSIQPQYLYIVVKNLLSHLEEGNEKMTPVVRTIIADILSNIISIAANQGIGPTVLDVINTILKHLRFSVTRYSDSENEEEKRYQRALITALGEFTIYLPHYQKVEIMMFILSKITSHRIKLNDKINSREGVHESKNKDLHILHVYLESLSKVCSKYSGVNTFINWPLCIFTPLMQCSRSTDATTRLLMHRILHNLFDRRGNGPKFAVVTVEFTQMKLKLRERKKSKNNGDAMFMKKCSAELYDNLIQSIKHENNTLLNMKAIYKTYAILCVELIDRENVAEFALEIIKIQDLALCKTYSLPFQSTCNLHVIVLCLLLLVGTFFKMSALLEYVGTILKARRQEYSGYLIPPLREQYAIVNELEPKNLSPKLIVTEDTLMNCLAQSEVNLTKWNELHKVWEMNNTYEKYVTSQKNFSNNSENETIVKANNNRILPSHNFKKQAVSLSEDTSFDAMKRIANNSDKVTTPDMNEIVHNNRNLSFAELLKITNNRYQSQPSLSDKVSEVLLKFNRLNRDDVLCKKTPTLLVGDCAPSEKYFLNTIGDLKFLYPECFR